jgi:hypothetical protein
MSFPSIAEETANNPAAAAPDTAETETTDGGDGIASLAAELDACGSKLPFAFDLVALLKERAVPVERIGQLQFSNQRMRALLVSECVAIVAHAELLRRLSSRESRTPALCCTSFLNALCGFGGGGAGESDALWKDAIVRELTRAFPSLLLPEEQQRHARLQTHVLMFQVLHSLMRRTGLRLTAACFASVIKFLPFGHDRSPTALRASFAAAPVDFSVCETDVSDKSVERLARLVDETVDSDADWTAMAMLVDAESVASREESVGSELQVAASNEAPVLDQVASAPPPSDDDWFLLHDRPAPTAALSEDDTVSAAANKSPKLDLRAKLTGLKLSLLELSNSLKAQR